MSLEGSDELNSRDKGNSLTKKNLNCFNGNDRDSFICSICQISSQRACLTDKRAICPFSSRLRLLWCRFCWSSFSCLANAGTSSPFLAQHRLRHLALQMELCLLPALGCLFGCRENCPERNVNWQLISFAWAEAFFLKFNSTKIFHIFHNWSLNK